jgi:hypothetical protein
MVRTKDQGMDVNEKKNYSQIPRESGMPDMGDHTGQEEEE